MTTVQNFGSLFLLFICLLGRSWRWFCLCSLFSLMEGSLLLESLDSLWFFSNLFSSKTPPVMDLSNEKHPSKPTQPVGGNREIESPKAELLSPRKPMKPMIHSQQIESPKTESLCPECTKCVEFGAETEPQSFPVERIILQEVEFAKHVKKEEKRSKTKRRERRSKRKILGELNLGFDEKRACSWNYDVWEMNYEANACGYGKLRSPQHFVKMPPLNDGSAMKEHLKSWAYAVACTVR